MNLFYIIVILTAFCCIGSEATLSCGIGLYGDVQLLETRVVICPSADVSGKIPETIMQMNKLETIVLSKNNLIGELPKGMGSLKQSLKHMHLDSNRLAGELPTEIGNLHLLNTLVLNNNALNGVLPSTIGNLEQLEIFNVAHNIFTGNLPSNLVQLSNLIQFDVSNNDLHGEIPDGFLASNPKLIILLLDNNRFSGNFFSQNLQSENSVAFLSAEHNDFTGTLSETVINATPKLVHLNLNDNKFSGPIPPNLMNLPDLLVVRLSGNKFDGDFNAIVDTVNQSTVKELVLSKNLISGSIPNDFIAKFPNLNLLDLSSNQLKGNIPHNIAALSSLHTIKLDNNKLEGNLPTFDGATTDHQILLLHFSAANNQLSGTIPVSFVCSIALHGLQVLDLSNNMLNGIIPTEIGLLTNLRTLKLNDNTFTGPLPVEIYKLSQLRHLEIASGNRISGTLDRSKFSNLQFTDVPTQQPIVNSPLSPPSIGSDDPLALFYLMSLMFVPFVVGCIFVTLRHNGCCYFSEKNQLKLIRSHNSYPEFTTGDDFDIEIEHTVTLHAPRSTNVIANVVDDKEKGLLHGDKDFEQNDTMESVNPMHMDKTPKLKLVLQNRKLSDPISYPEM